ncbi:hypothetical protein PIB30_015542 [Stylosanthes scabra]|uniref:Uncharacterized protein n=1 Tax=Stylosanthes scabra TaxID=79078 RepID=A0ABU6Z8T2_9FABA|nr:hypothetical protein [Stylosanthes scabra]
MTIPTQKHQLLMSKQQSFVEIISYIPVRVFDIIRFRHQPQPQPQPRPHPQPHPQHQHEHEGDRVPIADAHAEKTPQTHPSPQPHPKRTPNDNTNAETPAIDENLLPTQEVIDLSSSPEEDRQQPIVPKKEQDVETSPRSRIISSVLVSIRRDHQTLEPPSFDLGVEPPLLTPQTMDAIDDIDDQLKKNPELLRTPDPLGTFDILADMEKGLLFGAQSQRGIMSGSLCSNSRGTNI